MNALDINANEQCNSNLWNITLEKLKEEYGLGIYNSWFSHINFIDAKSGILRLSAPSKFVRECIINNYYNKIKQIISNLDPAIKMIDLRVRNSRPPKAENELVHANDDVGYKFNANDFETTNLKTKLDNKFTFNNFIEGESNKFALSAAKCIAEFKPQHPNILYIHGPVGMGKTHLLQAIASHVEANSPNLTASYLSADRFMHRYVLSIKNNSSLSFKEYLRNLDILLIDDLQFICGKTSTQQEFANTFNYLVESGKCVVISSDRSPYQIELDNRTKSRLAAGMVAEIKPADYDLRLKILTHLANIYNKTIDFEVLDFIAKSVSSSVRELEGALRNLIHRAEIAGFLIDLKHTQEVLRDTILAHEITITLDKIIDVVAAYYNISASDLVATKRAARFTFPRQVAMFIAKQLTSHSLKDIGYGIGKRDHATVIYSINKLESRLVKDSAIQHDVNKLIDILNRVTSTNSGL